MTKTICIIDGHPDNSNERLIHALCDAYQEGALEEGHTVERINICDLDFGFLNSASEFSQPPSELINQERDKIARSDHIVIAFPLWLGGMPAKLRAFIEHAARGNFFLDTHANESRWPERLMSGKSARVIVTMGMPGLVYRFAMDSGSLKALERGILGISGFSPVKHSVFGGAGEPGQKDHAKWIKAVRKLGLWGQ